MLFPKQKLPETSFSPPRPSVLLNLFHYFPAQKNLKCLNRLTQLHAADRSCANRSGKVAICIHYVCLGNACFRHVYVRLMCAAQSGPISPCLSFVPIYLLLPKQFSHPTSESISAKLLRPTAGNQRCAFRARCFRYARPNSHSAMFKLRLFINCLLLNPISVSSQR